MYTRQAKKAVSALADTVPFFGGAEETTHGKTVNPLPVGCEHKERPQGVVAEQGGRSQGGEDYNFLGVWGKPQYIKTPSMGVLI